jgi:predicted PurR-regulated permease PerM
VVPHRYRDNVAGVAREIDAAVSTWIRGQLIVISILAVLYAAAFKIIGIPMGLVIGATVGLLTIIPVLGTVVGAGLTGVVLLFDWQGSNAAIAVVAVFVVLHLLEAAVLTPKLVGKKVGLGELGALFAVLAGGKLLGFVGVLLAVPLAASVAVLVRRAFTYYSESSFYTHGEPAPNITPEPEPAAVPSPEPPEPAATVEPEPEPTPEPELPPIREEE